MTPLHTSVLLKEVQIMMDLSPGKTIVDATVGSGGHSAQISHDISPHGKLIMIDQDISSLQISKNIVPENENELKFVKGNFKEITSLILDSDVEKVDGILVDLGWSSDQFENGSRGFSFRLDGPLDMRLASDDTSLQPLTAATIVNQWDPEKIVQILREYGDEKYARGITKEIVNTRKDHLIISTTELADICSRVVRQNKTSKIHPATKTFQALRIAVNDEFSVLETFLQKAPKLLRSNGRLVVISFHSGEDRIVKNAFRNLSRMDEYKIITKKPITASPSEIAQNPRSRSAKLRVLQKV